MTHTVAAIILTHIIAFLTGYYLCYKNCRPRQSLTRHGINLPEIEERVQPQPRVDKE